MSLLTPASSLTPAIEIKDLRVDYGTFVAVNEVTLTVPPGEIFGLVGPNGAGKTSTFRVLATLMEPTYGEVRLAGVDIFEQPEAARRVLGYMPDLAPVPSDLKVWEFLDLFAEAHELGNWTARRERIEVCLRQVNLLEKWGDFCRTLSRGQTQRLVLAKTLLHRPRVFVLDEPASGMDPLSRRNLRLTLRSLADEGATIIVSSHILSELSEMCTSLCVMNHGRLLASGSVDEVRRLLGRAERTLTVGVLERSEEAAAWLATQAACPVGQVCARSRHIPLFRQPSRTGRAHDRAHPSGFSRRHLRGAEIHVRGHPRRCGRKPTGGPGQRRHSNLMTAPTRSRRWFSLQPIWPNPIFHRYARSRLRPQALSAALIITLIVAGFFFFLFRTLALYRDTWTSPPPNAPRSSPC